MKFSQPLLKRPFDILHGIDELYIIMHSIQKKRYNFNIILFYAEYFPNYLSTCFPKIWMMVDYSHSFMQPSVTVWNFKKKSARISFFMGCFFNATSSGVSLCLFLLCHTLCVWSQCLKSNSNMFILPRVPATCATATHHTHTHTQQYTPACYSFNFHTLKKSILLLPLLSSSIAFAPWDIK